MLTRALKEPILHFLLIGVVIFAAFVAIQDSKPEEDTVDIVIAPQTVERLAAQFEASWRRVPNAEEIEALIDSHLREEVLVREALTLSLDQGDTVIRQRLHQKMTFIVKSAAAGIEPADADLKTFFAERPARYADEGALAFEQVFLGTTPTEAEIARALTDLRSGRDPKDVGVASLIPFQFPLAVQQKIDGTLGPGMYRSLADLTEGFWGGPIRSGYGVHLGRVTKLKSPEIPPFESVRDMVLLDWRASFEAKLADAQFEQIRARYSVQRPSADEIKAILE